MTLLQILVVLAVVAAVAVVAAGVWRHGDTGGGTAEGAEGRSGVEVGLPEPTSSLPMLQLPADRLTGQDVDRLRFSIGLRGYRMDQVDQVLDELRDQLATKDRKIADLGAELGRRRHGPERTP